MCNTDTQFYINNAFNVKKNNDFLVKLTVITNYNIKKLNYYYFICYLRLFK